MITQCAWCRDTPDHKKPPPGEIITWTICDDCSGKLRRGEFEDMDLSQPKLNQQPKTQ